MRCRRYGVGMRVTPFDGEYDQIATLHQASARDLREADQRRGRFDRWLAWDGNLVVASATSAGRPDRRRFVRYEGSLDAVGALTTAASAGGRRALHAMVPGASPVEAALMGVGYRVEHVMENFEVRFDRALRRLERAETPRGFDVMSAADADIDRLFTLDNTLRQDVPGTDGWRGDRTAFRNEIRADQAFDAGGYLVASDVRNGEYAGLVRIWRNPTRPRVGMLGVSRQYRSTLLAAALLKEALTAASQWGSVTFEMGTSLSNRIVYPKLAGLEPVSLGRSTQLELRAGTTPTEIRAVET